MNPIEKIAIRRERKETRTRRTALRLSIRRFIPIAPSPVTGSPGIHVNPGTVTATRGEPTINQASHAFSITSPPQEANLVELRGPVCLVEGEEDREADGGFPRRDRAGEED